MQRSMGHGDFSGQSKVAQRASTISPPVEQVDWLNAAPRKKASDPVDIVHLRAIPTLDRAIAYSLHLAGMDPKEAYGPLNIDKASWSRMIRGQQGFPGHLIQPVRMLTGNQAGLMWMAYQDGCEIKPLRSELEQQIQARDEKIAELEQRLEIEREYARRMILERK